MKKNIFLAVGAILLTTVLTSTNLINTTGDKETMILINTSYGDITLKLYNETPKHRDNFIKLVNEGFYDGLLFHRVIQNFMIQGGDPDSKDAGPDATLGNGGPAYTIPSEIVYPELFHKKGALAAARQGDQKNPTRRSSGSQFYIVQGQIFNDDQLNQLEQKLGYKIPESIRQIYKTIGGTPHLDGQYTVFGEVVKGLDVVDKIAAIKTGDANRPLEDVKMQIKVIE